MEGGNIIADEAGASAGVHTCDLPVFAPRASRTYGMRCPHCLQPGNVRSSQEADVTLRAFHFGCSNPACGHTWKASLIYDYGLSPSAIPNPVVNLPMRPLPRETVLRAIADAADPPDPSQPGLFDP